MFNKQQQQTLPINILVGIRLHVYGNGVPL